MKSLIEKQKKLDSLYKILLKFQSENNLSDVELDSLLREIDDVKKLDRVKKILLNYTNRKVV